MKTPLKNRHRVSRALGRSLFLLLACSLVVAWGCNQNQPKNQPAAVKGGAELKREPLPDDPASKETRTAAGEILDRLLAGKLAEGESPLQYRAKALKGFQSWSIESQQQKEEGRATFDGLLTGAAGKARFNMILVKQKDGKWAVGAFSGPNPAE
jgi:hypothetical protein